jgi:hypothetical protein
MQSTEDDPTSPALIIENASTRKRNARQKAQTKSAPQKQNELCPIIRYCTVNVTTFPCADPPASVAVTVICDAPNAVGVATVTKLDPGADAAGDVAVTVTVVGLGTNAGLEYSPVPSTVPFTLPPTTTQVTL